MKTSLLFLRKRTEAERAQYDGWTDEAALEARTTRLPDISEQKEILAQPQGKQADFLPSGKKVTNTQKNKATKMVKEFNESLKEAKKNAARRLKEIDAEILVEARRGLRKKARYPIFMYEADYVGIGGTDENELIPNAHMPSGITASALEQFQRFSADPEAFLQASSPLEIAA